MWVVFKIAAKSMKMNRITLGYPMVEDRGYFRQKTERDERFPLKAYYWYVQRTDGRKAALLPPMFDKIRKLYTIWDDVENKTFYTDLDLEHLHAKGEITKGDVRIVWRQLIDGFPYLHKEIWHHFELKDGKCPPIVPSECNFNGRRIESGQFFAVDPEYKAGDTLPITLEWKLNIPESPWRVKQKHFGSIQQAHAYFKKMGLYVIEDLGPVADDRQRGTVFYLNSAMQTALFWGVSSSWTPYRPFLPGDGPFSDSLFQRKNVEVKNGVFTWRDPVTQALYALVEGEDYEKNWKLTKEHVLELRSIVKSFGDIPALMEQSSRIMLTEYAYKEFRKLQGEIRYEKQQLESMESALSNEKAARQTGSDAVGKAWGLYQTAQRRLLNKFKSAGAVGKMTGFFKDFEAKSRQLLENELRIKELLRGNINSGDVSSRVEAIIVQCYSEADAMYRINKSSIGRLRSAKRDNSDKELQIAWRGFVGDLEGDSDVSDSVRKIQMLVDNTKEDPIPVIENFMVLWNRFKEFSSDIVKTYANIEHAVENKLPDLDDRMEAELTQLKPHLHRFFELLKEEMALKDFLISLVRKELGEGDDDVFQILFDPFKIHYMLENRRQFEILRKQERIEVIEKTLSELRGIGMQKRFNIYKRIEHKRFVLEDHKIVHKLISSMNSDEQYLRVLKTKLEDLKINDQEVADMKKALFELQKTLNALKNSAISHPNNESQELIHGTELQIQEQLNIVKGLNRKVSERNGLQDAIKTTNAKILEQRERIMEIKDIDTGKVLSEIKVLQRDLADQEKIHPMSKIYEDSLLNSDKRDIEIMKKKIELVKQIMQLPFWDSLKTLMLEFRNQERRLSSVEFFNRNNEKSVPLQYNEPFQKILRIERMFINTMVRLGDKLKAYGTRKVLLRDIMKEAPIEQQDNPVHDEFGMEIFKSNYKVLEWKYQPELPEPILLDKGSISEHYRWTLKRVLPAPSDILVKEILEETNRDWSPQATPQSPSAWQEEARTKNAQNERDGAKMGWAPETQEIPETSGRATQVKPRGWKTETTAEQQKRSDLLAEVQDFTEDLGGAVGLGVSFLPFTFRLYPTRPDFLRELMCEFCGKDIRSTQETVLVTEQGSDCYMHWPCFFRQYNGQLKQWAKKSERVSHLVKTQNAKYRKWHVERESQEQKQRNEMIKQKQKEKWERENPDLVQKIAKRREAAEKRKEEIRKTSENPTQQNTAGGPGRGAGVRLVEGDLSLFPVIRYSAIENVDVTSRVKRPVGISPNPVYSYTNYADWYTWLYRDIEERGKWVCIFSPAILPHHRFEKDRLYHEDQVKKFKLEEANERGLTVQKRRQCKKISTDFKYYSSHFERCELQKDLPEGLVIFPINVAKARALRLEVTNKELVDTRSLLSKMRSARNKAFNDLGRGNLLENNTSGYNQLFLITNGNMEMIQSNQLRSAFFLGGHFHPKEFTAPLQTPPGLDPMDWKVIMRNLKGEVFSKYIKPPADSLVQVDGNLYAAVTFSDNFSLLKCFNYFETMKSYMGQQIDGYSVGEGHAKFSYDPWAEDRKIINEIRENRAKAHLAYHNLIMSTYKNEGCDRYISKLIADGVLQQSEYSTWIRMHKRAADWKRELWIDAIVLAIRYNVQLKGYKMPFKYTDGTWTTYDHFTPNPLRPDIWRHDTATLEYGQKRPPFKDRPIINIFLSNPMLDKRGIWNSPNFHLLVEFTELVTSKLVRFYTKRKDLFKGREMLELHGENTDEVYKQKEKSKEVFGVDGKIQTDFTGNLAIYNIVVKEQPWNNYSFFSSCRDALAAHFDVKPTEIANTLHFIAEWVQHLHTLPDFILNLLVQSNGEIKIPDVRNGEKGSKHKTQQFIINEIVEPILSSLEQGRDIEITEKSFWIFSVAGIPASAFRYGALESSRAEIHSVVFQLAEERSQALTPMGFYGREKFSSELADQLEHQGYYPATMTIPLLLLKTSAVTSSMQNGEVLPHKGSTNGHFYHLLTATDAAQKAAKRSAIVYENKVAQEKAEPSLDVIEQELEEIDMDQAAVDMQILLEQQRVAKEKKERDDLLERERAAEAVNKAKKKYDELLDKKGDALGVDHRREIEEQASRINRLQKWKERTDKTWREEVADKTRRTYEELLVREKELQRPVHKPEVDVRVLEMDRLNRQKDIVLEHWKAVEDQKLEEQKLRAEEERKLKAIEADRRREEARAEARRAKDEQQGEKDKKMARMEERVRERRAMEISGFSDMTPAEKLEWKKAWKKKEKAKQNAEYYTMSDEKKKEWSDRYELEKQLQRARDDEEKERKNRAMQRSNYFDMTEQKKAEWNKEWDELENDKEEASFSEMSKAEQTQWMRDREFQRILARNETKQKNKEESEKDFVQKKRAADRAKADAKGQTKKSVQEDRKKAAQRKEAKTAVSEDEDSGDDPMGNDSQGPDMNPKADETADDENEALERDFAMQAKQRMKEAHEEAGYASMNKIQRKEWDDQWNNLEAIRKDAYNEAGYAGMNEAQRNEWDERWNNLETIRVHEKYYAMTRTDRDVWLGENKRELKQLGLWGQAKRDRNREIRQEKRRAKMYTKSEFFNAPFIHYDPDLDHLPFLGVEQTDTGVPDEGWRPSSMQIALRNQKSNALQVSDPFSSTSLSIYKQDYYVTGTHSFPKNDYFQRLPIGVYPGINDFPVIKPGKAQAGQWERQADMFYSFNTGDFRAATLGSLMEPSSTEFTSTNHSKQGDSLLKEIHLEVWLDVQNKHNKIPLKKNFLINSQNIQKLDILKRSLEMIDENHLQEHEKAQKGIHEFVTESEFLRKKDNRLHFILSQMLEAYTLDVVEFLKQREKQRIIIFQTNKSFAQRQAPLEPWSDVYEGEPPDLGLFADKFLPALLPLVQGWVRKAQDIHEDVFADADLKQMILFLDEGYLDYVRLSVEAQWVESMQDRIVAKLPVATELSAPKPSWTPKTETAYLMKRSFRAPSNGTLEALCSKYRFELGTNAKPLTDLTDIFESSFHNKENTGTTMGDKFQTYKMNALNRIAEEYYIDTSISQYKYPLKMEVLRMLAKAYCSDDDSIFRPIPSVNFIVVECNHGSPLPGQLSIVLMSDPRGIASALQLMDFKLPQVHSSNIPERINNSPISIRNKLVHQAVRDAHQLQRIAILLRKDGNFYLLKTIDSSSACDSSVSALLAGAKAGERELGDWRSAVLNDEARPRSTAPGDFTAEYHEFLSTESFAKYAASDGDYEWAKSLHNTDARSFDAKSTAEALDARIMVFDHADDRSLRLRDMHDARRDVLNNKRRAYLTTKNSKMKLIIPVAEALRTKDQADKKFWELHGFAKRTRDGISKLLAVAKGMHNLKVALDIKFSKTPVQMNGIDLNVQDGFEYTYWEKRFNDCLGLPTYPGFDEPPYVVEPLNDLIDSLLIFGNLLRSMTASVMPPIASTLTRSVATLHHSSAMCTVSPVYTQEFILPYREMRRVLEEQQNSLGGIQATGAQLQTLQPYTHNEHFERRLFDNYSGPFISGTREGLLFLKGVVTGSLRQAAAFQGRLMSRFKLDDRQVRTFVCVSPKETCVDKFKKRLKLRLIDTLQGYHDDNTEYVRVNEGFRPIDPILPFFRHDGDMAGYQKTLREKEAQLLRRQELVAGGLPTAEVDDIITQKSATLEEITQQGFSVLESFNWYKNAMEEIEEKTKERDQLEQEDGKGHIDAIIQEKTAMVEEQIQQKILVWNGTIFAPVAFAQLKSDYIAALTEEEDSKQKYTELITATTDQVVMFLSDSLHDQLTETMKTELDRAMANQAAAGERVQVLNTRIHRMEREKRLKERGIISKRNKFWYFKKDNQEFRVHENHLPQCTLENVSKGTSPWNRVPVFPAWEEGHWHESPDLWMDPTTRNYFFQDYERKLWHCVPGGEWKEFSGTEWHYYLEIFDTLTDNQLRGVLAKHVGIHQNDLNVHALRSTRTINTLDERYQIQTILLKEADRRVWMPNTTFEETIDEDDWVVRNNNRGRLKDHSKKHENWAKIKAENEKRRMEQADKRGFFDSMKKEEEHIRTLDPYGDSFEAVRWIGIISGCPNHISVEFASDNRQYQKNENPVIAFRQAWILRGCPTGSNMYGEVIIIRRQQFNNVVARIKDRIFCNPTGINARNVERYWGFELSNPDFAPTFKDERLQRRKLWGSRLLAFHAWIHNPRNWYWDESTRQFYAFAFAPDMVEVRLHGKTYLVQQQTVYPVSIVCLKTEEFSDRYLQFLKDRNGAYNTWTQLETENPMDPGLHEELKSEIQQDVFSDDLCGKIDTYYDVISEMTKERLTDWQRFVDYYHHISEHFISSSTLAFQIEPPPLTNNSAIQTKEEILLINGQKQLKTRSFFRLLFQQKFNMDYSEFLINKDKRADVLTMCPEALGPKGFPPSRPNEKDLFIKHWEEFQKEEQLPFAEFFPWYFKNHVFKDVDPYSDNPHHNFRLTPMSEGATEAWYLENANVQYTEIDWAQDAPDTWQGQEDHRYYGRHPANPYEVGNRQVTQPGGGHSNPSNGEESKDQTKTGKKSEEELARQAAEARWVQDQANKKAEEDEKQRRESEEEARKEGDGTQKKDTKKKTRKPKRDPSGPSPASPAQETHPTRPPPPAAPKPRDAGAVTAVFGIPGSNWLQYKAYDVVADGDCMLESIIFLLRMVDENYRGLSNQDLRKTLVTTLKDLSISDRVDIVNQVMINTQRNPQLFEYEYDEFVAHSTPTASPESERERFNLLWNDYIINTEFHKGWLDQAEMGILSKLLNVSIFAWKIQNPAQRNFGSGPVEEGSAVYAGGAQVQHPDQNHHILHLRYAGGVHYEPTDIPMDYVPPLTAEDRQRAGLRARPRFGQRALPQLR